jgi:hypothetical protein
MHVRDQSLPWYFPSRIVFISILILITAAPGFGQFQPAFDSPELVSPANSEITTVENFPPLGLPTFMWKPESEATLYHLQLSTDSLFISSILLEIHTPNTQFTPTDIERFPDGDYYWRVRVEEPLPGSAFSDPWRFSKIWASEDNVPILVNPIDGETMAFMDAPGFSWELVPGAASYRLQIATSVDNFDTPVYSLDTAATRHQPPYKFPNGSYYWRVLPLDPAGYVGASSQSRTFILAYGSSYLNQTPALIGPANNEVLSFTPTFQWSAVLGAQVYRLEYTPGPICNFSAATVVETSQTSHTPLTNFPSTLLYCWRVRAQSGLSIGDWSETRIFTYNWTLTSRLLTPTFNYPYTRTPVFSWTPVPGAAYYQIELESALLQVSFDFQSTTSNPFWISPMELPYTQYHWQVTPYDQNDNPGTPSQVSIFENPLLATVPALVYPLYYYPPNDPVSYGNISLDPVEDRTVAWPLFVWQRVFNPPPFGGLLARAYLLQVSRSPYFTSLDWEIITQNTSATPTLEYPFSPLPDLDYYWRVCPYEPILSTCYRNPDNGDVLWSQIWIARFDSALSLTPIEDNSPQLIRPANGHEQVEGTPLMDWLPLAAASHYQLQISRDPSFASIEHEAFPTIPLYASPVSLAQRNLNRTDYGTFYWRVRGIIEGSPTEWSEIRRFQIASQSEWRRVRTLGELQNKLLVGDDPTDDTSDNFDLTTLYITQSDQAWYLGFNVGTDPIIDMTYAIYIDTDHRDGSGGVTPPERPYVVSTIPAHLPEYVLYIDQIGGNFNASNTILFTWNGSTWSFGQSLYALGGAVYYTPGTPGYLEIQLPDAAIAFNRPADSLSAIVFSINSNGVVLDTVPEDPNVPGSAELSRLTSVSDRMNLVSPQNGVTGITDTISSVLPIFWDWPTGADPTGYDYAPPTPFAGAQLQVSIDPQFTIIVANLTLEANAHYIGTPAATLSSDLIGDATYYWRVRPRYLNAGVFWGAWSATYSFTREGFSTGNLRVSSTDVTPIFQWDRAEGAAMYNLQVSTQLDFDPAILDITTSSNTYTPSIPLAPGNYYWRVGLIRQDVIQSKWSPPQGYSLTLPAPSGLTPNNASQAIFTIPSLCWQSLIGYSDDTPVLSAWKYRIQVSYRSDFQTLFDSIDTEMHCWTPHSWYPQGIYYWRVAMIDGAGHLGGYSAPAIFYLQYPTTTLLTPISIWVPNTPTYVWIPVSGMASYRLEVSLEADFYPLFEWIETVNTQYTPDFMYLPEQVYFWRVAASTADGNTSAFHSTYFSIGSPRIWLPIVKK